MSNNGNGNSNGKGGDAVVINSLQDLNALHAKEHTRRAVEQQSRYQNQLQQLMAGMGAIKRGAMTGNIATTEVIRTDFLRFLLDGVRDIDAECGYPTWLTPDHYRAMYDREGIARRVVHCEPEESWAMDPELYEDDDPETDTPFEAAWKGLLEEHNIWDILLRLDCLSGIGQYGLLLLGIDDGESLHEPVRGLRDDGTFDEGNEFKLLYLRVFSEEVVFCKARETDVHNRRYGLPKMYTIQFRDYPNWGIQAGEIIARDVHWSRVIHLPSDKKMSEVYGTPRMQPVWNRLYDLRKILSSSGEGYWKGAFPGIAFELNPELADQGIEMDTESIREEFKKYTDGLQRYLAVQGVTAKTLPPEVVDPTGIVMTHMRQIATAKGIPYRILFGSEEAQLAGTQDARAWNRRMAKRQQKLITPAIIKPFANRLIAFGVLPKPGEPLKVDWPDLNSPTDMDKAQVAMSRTQTMQSYVGGQVHELVPPDVFLTEIMGFSTEQKDAILEAAAAQADRMQEEAMEQGQGEEGLDGEGGGAGAGGGEGDDGGDGGEGGGAPELDDAAEDLPEPEGDMRKEKPQVNVGLPHKATRRAKSTNAKKPDGDGDDSDDEDDGAGSEWGEENVPDQGNALDTIHLSRKGIKEPVDPDTVHSAPALVASSVKFDESKHKRAQGGRFGDMGGKQGGKGGQPGKPAAGQQPQPKPQQSPIARAVKAVQATQAAGQGDSTRQAGDKARRGPEGSNGTAGGGKAGKSPDRGQGNGKGLPALSWQEPPKPLGKGGKAGGFSATGRTNTEIGDLGEKVLAVHLGMKSLLPPGKRQNPLDMADGDGNGYEVKVCTTYASEYKVKMKAKEVRSKKRYAKANGLKPRTMIVVMDTDAGVAHAYSREGIGSWGLSGATGWQYHGQVSL